MTNVQYLKEIYTLQDSQINIYLPIQVGTLTEIFSLNYHILILKVSKQFNYFSRQAMLLLAVEFKIFRIPKLLMIEQALP